MKLPKILNMGWLSPSQPMGDVAMPPREGNTRGPYKKIQQSYVARSREDINTWKVAVRQAENVALPRRYLLAKLYRQIVFDNHLKSVVQSRKNMTLSKPYQIVDAGGLENTELTKLFNTKWFMDFMGETLESVFRGYSVIELGDLVQGQDGMPMLQEVIRIPDEYTCPQHGLVLRNIGDVEGMDIYSPEFAPYTIGVGNAHSFGLYADAAYWILWKQNVAAAWTEFAELFGQPFRVGETDIFNEELRQAMIDAMKDFGSSAWAVINKDSKIDFVQANKTDSYKVYAEFLQYVDNQLSKLVLGQTGTSDEKSYVGAAQVHMDIAEMYSQADSLLIEHTVNTELLPRLTAMGFAQLGGCRFKFDSTERLSLNEQSDIIVKLLQYYDIDPKYISDTLGIPVSRKEAGVDKPMSDQAPINPKPAV